MDNNGKPVLDICGRRTNWLGVARTLLDEQAESAAILAEQDAHEQRILRENPTVAAETEIARLRAAVQHLAQSQDEVIIAVEILAERVRRMAGGA